MYPRGKRNSISVWKAISLELLHGGSLRTFHTFVSDLQHLDRNVVAFGVEIHRVVLAGPRFYDLPTSLVGSRFIDNYNRDVLAIDCSVDNSPVPLVQLHRVGDPPFQSHVAILC